MFILNKGKFPPVKFSSVVTFDYFIKTFHFFLHLAINEVNNEESLFVFCGCFKISLRSAVGLHVIISVSRSVELVALVQVLTQSRPA